MSPKTAWRGDRRAGLAELSDVADDGQRLDSSSSIEDALPTVLDTDHPVPVVGEDGGLAGVLYPDHVGEVLSPSAVQAVNDDTPPDEVAEGAEAEDHAVKPADPEADASEAPADETVEKADASDTDDKVETAAVAADDAEKAKDETSDQTESDVKDKMQSETAAETDERKASA
jgi:hypothetical protein